ncbi:MAG: CinA family protein [Puniceicoccales bacterium]|jgi:nicotinamide mononucleotide (NMN) deamidase PncC|nr:CinA family protein [Puniceicoccales bacterium]
MNQGGIRAIDGSPDGAHYTFQGGAGENVASLVAMCVAILLRRGQTVAFVEVLTGGMLSNLWHCEADVDRILDGTLVISGGETLWPLLGITEVFLENFGASSREVALAIAEGIRELTGSNFSIAVGGVADRRFARGNCTFWLAVRTPIRKIVQKIDVDATGRDLLRERACYAVCKIFLQILFEEE